MKKLGIFVGEKGKWGFFNEIFDDLSKLYQVDVFKERIFNTPLLYGRLNRWAYQQGIRRILQRNEVCFFEWASELLIPASHMPKTSYIITRMHSYEIHVWADKVNWDHVDRVIFVGSGIRDLFCEQYPQHAHKAVLVFNGVNLRKFKPVDRRNFRFSLGMVSNFHPIKRIYETVLMVYDLKQKGYEPHLHVAGARWPGGYFDDYYIAICRLIDKLGLESNVTLHGPVSDVPRLLDDIDVFISNSFWEGQQMALLEAMAAGCYCLSHIWNGVEDALPEENLYVTESELEQKLLTFASAPESERLRLHAQMRAIACEKFDQEMMKAGVIRVVKEAMGSR